MSTPLRVLALVPQPIDASWTPAAAAAWSALESALGAAVAAGGIEVVRVSPPTAGAFESALQREPFDIVHLIARGTSRPAARYGTVTLEGSDRRPRDLNAQNFARLCSQSDGLQAVVLQPVGSEAADLAVLARAVAEQAAPVVSIGTSGAEAFLRTLYACLTTGDSVEAAFARASGNPSGLPATAPRTSDATLLPRPHSTPRRSPRAAAETPAAPKSRAVEEAPISAAANGGDDAGAGTEAQKEIERKRLTGQFDVFLCHNVGDKPAVIEIGRRLMAQGVLPWLDQWELRPGMPWQRLLEEQISHIRAAAVFVGRDGIGPWQRQELDGFLREFNKRNCPVIPVMLPGAAGEPQLPLFLRGMTWVDFRVTEPNPLAQLIWGITGQRPALS